MFVLFIPCACAEDIDFSGMSLSELTVLRSRIQLAMMETDEWQEVVIPQGVWEVGKDIPAGTWTIKCLPKQRAEISWGELLTDNGENIKSEFGTRFSLYNMIYSQTYGIYKEGDPMEYTFTVQEGDFIVIKHSSVIFTPYHGKPDLGFK